MIGWSRCRGAAVRYVVAGAVPILLVGCGGSPPGPSARSPVGAPTGSSAPSATASTTRAVAADPPPPAASLHQVTGRPAPATGPTPEIEQPGPGTGRLRTLPGGLVLLAGRGVTADDGPASVTPVAGSPSSVWTPDGALPPPASPRQPVDVFYPPHPDDETLSMGVLIADAARRGHRVIVVALTDGRTTGAVLAIDARLAARRADSASPARAPRAAAHTPTHTPAHTPTHTPARSPARTPAQVRRAAGQAPAAQPAADAAGRLLTDTDVATARIGELRRATTDLGVPERDVVLAHLDAPGSDGGARATVAEAEQVMRALAARFPGATHVTMSDVAERQPDHLDAGIALHRLLDAGVVTSARWTVSRLYWSRSAPAWSWALPDPVVRWRVRRAALEYQTWEPERGEYAVGFYSVRWQFAALGRDVRARVHGTGPLRPGL